jgi:hypothetical protein
LLNVQFEFVYHRSKRFNWFCLFEFFFEFFVDNFWLSEFSQVHDSKIRTIVFVFSSTNKRFSFYVHDWVYYKKRNIDTFLNEWWIDSFVLYIFVCNFAFVDVILNMKMIAYCLIICLRRLILDAWYVKTKCFNLDIYWYNKLFYVLSSIALIIDSFDLMFYSLIFSFSKIVSLFHLFIRWYWAKIIIDDLSLYAEAMKIDYINN